MAFVILHEAFLIFTVVVFDFDGTTHFVETPGAFQRITVLVVDHSITILFILFPVALAVTPRLKIVGAFAPFLVLDDLTSISIAFGVNEVAMAMPFIVFPITFIVVDELCPFKKIHFFFAVNLIFLLVLTLAFFYWDVDIFFDCKNS